MSTLLFKTHYKNARDLASMTSTPDFSQLVGKHDVVVVMAPTQPKPGDTLDASTVVHRGPDLYLDVTAITAGRGKPMSGAIVGALNADNKIDGVALPPGAQNLTLFTEDGSQIMPLIASISGEPLLPQNGTIYGGSMPKMWTLISRRWSASAMKPSASPSTASTASDAMSDALIQVRRSALVMTV